MRLGIFVSLAVVCGVASFAASACDTRADYNNKINKLQTDYQVSVDIANKAYVEKTIYRVRRPTANLLDWQNAVNAALDSYTQRAQETYDNYVSNACLWWW